ncbi:MAG: hypothetical protein ACPLPT_02000 [Moorellales bacterium]
MKPKPISAWTIAATYVGTVVGAAFASGQEILQFFGYFGAWGLAGLLVTTALLVVFGYLIMDTGRELRARSYRPVIQAAAGPWVGRILDWVITLFLFGALLIMSAGSGAFFREHLGLPFVPGSAVMALATWATVLAGLGGVITAISLIAPVLLLSALGLGLYALGLHWPQGTQGFFWAEPARAPVPFWSLSALVYTSYNLLLALAVLAPLGARAERPNLWKGALGGGLALGAAATAIFLAVMAQGRGGAAKELPMLVAAAEAGPLVAWGYGLVLVAEIYTTAVSSLYGFASRLGAEGGRFRMVASLATAGGFVLAQFGFSRLVGIVFPAVGYAGIALLVALTLQNPFWRRLPDVVFSRRAQPATKKFSRKVQTEDNDIEEIPKPPSDTDLGGGR